MVARPTWGNDGLPIVNLNVLNPPVTHLKKGFNFQIPYHPPLTEWLLRTAFCGSLGKDDKVWLS